jgi:uncharacterized protein (DUF433 family)
MRFNNNIVRRLVVKDPEILGGEPVFRSTRIPVHFIAELIARGTPRAELRKSFPRLTDEMIRLAPVYAARNPQRQRLRKFPWHDRQPVHRVRRKLSSITLRVPDSV